MRHFAILLALLIAAGGQQVSAADEFRTDSGPLTVTPIQHASLMITAGSQVLQVDPWGRENYADLPPADIVLITHTHGDHLDPEALAAVSKAGTVVIAPPDVAKTVTQAKVLRNGESTKVGAWSFEAVPMYNEERGPSPGKVFHEKGLGNGYIVEFAGLRLYIAGDTEGTAEMRALQDIDVAFVPMNLPYTMPPLEAAEAVKAFKPKVVYPYHYRGSDLSVFEKALEGSGIEVRLRDWYR